MQTRTALLVGTGLTLGGAALTPAYPLAAWIAVAGLGWSSVAAWRDPAIRARIQQRLDRPALPAPPPSPAPRVITLPLAAFDERPAAPLPDPTLAQLLAAPPVAAPPRRPQNPIQRQDAVQADRWRGMHFADVPETLRPTDPPPALLAERVVWQFEQETRVREAVLADADSWAILLVWSERALSLARQRVLRERVAGIETLPYSGGGVTTFVLLGRPLAATGTTVPIPRPVMLPVLPDADRWDTEPDASAAAATDDPAPIDLPSRVPRRPPLSVDRFLQYERPAAPSVRPVAAPDAAPTWGVDARLPTLTIGTDPRTGQTVTIPLEHTAIIAPTQQGKTSLIIQLVAQLLMATQDATGEGVDPWFCTTKWEATNRHGVPIGDLLRRTWNVANLDAPCGIEDDATGTFRVLRLLVRELQARIAQSGALRPLVAIFDEWEDTAAALRQRTFPRRAAEGVSDDADDLPEWALVETMPRQPLEAANQAFARLLRKGLGKHLIVFLVTQSAQVQNIGLNSGVLSACGTWIVHTELDAASLQRAAKDDGRKLAAIRQIRQQVGATWIVVRGDQVQPVTFPHVTTEHIRGWLAALPDAPTPVPSADDLTRWPDAAQAALARIDPARRAALIKALTACGVNVPLRVSGGERRTLLGLDGRVSPAPRLRPLLRQLRQGGTVTTTHLAWLLFGRTGQAVTDLTEALLREEGR